MRWELIDTIVCCDDAQGLPELDRCIFSVVGQSFRPLNIILVLCCFTPDQETATLRMIEPLLELANESSLNVINVPAEKATKGRAALFNIGLDACIGRFVAAFDHQVVLYPDALESLVSRLKATDSGLALGSMRLVETLAREPFIQTKRLSRPPQFAGHLREVFGAKIHPRLCCLMDRRLVSDKTFRFDESLTCFYEYERLLRICAQVKSDLQMLRIEIADCDHRRSLLQRTTAEFLSAEHHPSFTALFDARRKFIPVSSEVQTLFGISDGWMDMSIHDVMSIDRARFPLDPLTTAIHDDAGPGHVR